MSDEARERARIQSRLSLLRQLITLRGRQLRAARATQVEGIWPGMPLTSLRNQLTELEEAIDALRGPLGGDDE